MEGLNVLAGSIPTICSDYYYGVGKRAHVSSREEKLRRVLKNFLPYYNRENPTQKLDATSRGLVVIQQGLPPYDMEIIFSPEITNRANAQVILMENTLQKGFSVVMNSACYWLKEGKLQLILDAQGVLEDAICHKVAKKFLKAPVYKGVFSVSFEVDGFYQPQARPCRVYAEGEELLLMNLLNGLIFKVKKGELLMEPLGEKFRVDLMFFRRVFGGFERY